jgi:aminotransferase
MALSLSKRADHIVQSEIRNMSVECDRVGGINLSQGVCDTEVALPVRRGAQAAIDEGVNSYTRFDGIDELRNALARKLRTYGGVEYDPENEIVASAGSTGAFYCACLALLNEGDEVVLFEPFYGYHVNTLLAVGTVPTYVRLRAPDWTFSAADLERVVTPRTRGIMINTPGNPTGKVWSRAELELVGDFAKKHDLFVFTDEIYEHFLYDGRTHVSPASIPGLRERTILISGLSKTFSITGWRIGYAACEARWAKMIGYMSDLVYVCPPAPLQVGVARGLDALPPEYYGGLCAEYRVKRDRVCDALDKAKLTPIVPQGAYYVLADLSRLNGATSKDRCIALLRTTGVASVPGSAFFHDGAGDRLARFCFAKRDEVLEEACRRLARL